MQTYALASRRTSSWSCSRVAVPRLTDSVSAACSLDSCATAATASCSEACGAMPVANRSTGDGDGGADWTARLLALRLSEG